MVKLYVVVASIGRAALLTKTVAHLAHQTRVPDGIIVVSVDPSDVEGLNPLDNPTIEIIFANKGLPIQRNAGLRHLAGKADIIAFFDDDFVPAPDYLQQLEQLFEERPKLVGATGRMVADGIKSSGIAFETALTMLQGDPIKSVRAERKMPALYGCNLCIRVSAAENIWFDELLPLYGWQEDVDFSYRVGQRGDLLLTDALSGVHLGTKAGRTSGKRLGYSQIANPIYLLCKKTIPKKLAWRLMVKNVLANLIKAPLPEAFVDRPGRLRGNLIALTDLVAGRLHPQRILTL